LVGWLEFNGTFSTKRLYRTRAWGKVTALTGGVCYGRRTTKCHAAVNRKPKRTEQNLIVCIGKSDDKITNNKRLHSMYCTVKLTRHKASRGLSAIAELFVCPCGCVVVVVVSVECYFVVVIQSK